MKFTMFQKETGDKRNLNNPFRAVNFPINQKGNSICSNEKKSHYLYSKSVKGNKYDRTKNFY